MENMSRVPCNIGVIIIAPKGGNPKAECLHVFVSMKTMTMRMIEGA